MTAPITKPGQTADASADGWWTMNFEVMRQRAEASAQKIADAGIRLGAIGAALGGLNVALPKMAKIEITSARGISTAWIGGRYVGRVLDIDMSGGDEVKMTLVARGPEVSFVEKRSPAPVEPAEFGLSCAHLADDHLVFDTRQESVDQKIARAADEVLTAIRLGLPRWSQRAAYERD